MMTTDRETQRLFFVFVVDVDEEEPRSRKEQLIRKIFNQCRMKKIIRKWRKE